MGMTDRIINTSRNRYRQYENPYGVKINIACFSCKWASNNDLQNNKRCALVHADDPDEKVHERTYACKAWTPCPQYEVAGSGHNPAGGVATPGKVKTSAYLHWYAYNHGFMQGTIHDIRQLFEEQNPGLKVFY